MSMQPVYTTRREFLTGGLGLLSAATTMPVFLGHTLRLLADEPGPAGKKGDSQRVLVVVQMAGGNDGLSMVVPYEQDEYYKYRPQLAIRKQDVLRLEGGVGLHPAATGLKSLYDDGRLAVIQGVGYPNPNRSHFTSMDIWHTADPQQKQRDGWIGRYFDACCKGADPAPEPIQGIALMGEAPLAMQGDSFSPLAFENADALTWRGAGQDARAARLFRELNQPGPGSDAQSELAQYLQRAALAAQLGADDIRGAAAGKISSTTQRGRRGQLGPQLQMVARMIKAGLPTRIYYVSMGGFDTHAGQAGRHQQLMDQLGDAVAGFMDTLKEDQLQDRVLMMTFSEFGRRVQENASGGTDHGEAAPMMLIGSKVRPGVHEKHPDLSKLHRGDLAFTTDFRKVYATVLREWLKIKPDAVLGGNVGSLNVLNARS